VGRGYLIVEGHGDTEAALNLVTRLCADLRLQIPAWKALRGKNLHQERGILKVCHWIRSKPDCDVLLILRDEDDACPKSRAPEMATWLRNQGLRFPAAIVLAHREFEAFFLPCIARMAGQKLVDAHGIERPGLIREARFEGDPEGMRGVKEWLSKKMPDARSYKPALDQLPLARRVVFADIRAHIPPLPCFGSLERALQFLSAERNSTGNAVYPPAEK
jgi:hypothetical protein